MDKKLAIRYIVYRVAQEFNKFHRKEVTDKAYFNENNNFTLEKCLLLPYIITIANGNKNFFLEDIFNNSFLPILLTNDKKVIIGDLKDEVFNIYTADDIGLQFNGDKLIFNFTEGDFDFTEDVAKNQKMQLKYNINYSIKFFVERRYKNFALLNEEILKKITYQNSAFDVMYNFFKDKNISNNILVTYFNAVAKKSFYFTYYNEKIEEDVDMSSQT